MNKPNNNEWTKTFDATLEELEAVMVWIADIAKSLGFSQIEIGHMQVSIEEAFVNIAHYAYPAETKGSAVIKCVYNQNHELEITLIDTGKPFNPFGPKKVIELEAPAEVREVGGLGIYLIQKLMNKIDYQRSADKNVLTMIKGKEVDPNQNVGNSTQGAITQTASFSPQLEELENIIKFVSELATHAKLPQAEIGHIQVAVEEVFTNIVNHSSILPDDEKVNVTYSFDPQGTTEITLSDSGKAFNPLSFPILDINASAEERSVGGLGIFFMKSLMNDVQYHRIDNRNELKLVKKLNSSLF
ncbi:MAG: rsbW [Chlamydiales bacterium]|jgi:anti-sigma regulatory factor (Ser/Thr protein kinase)|nr:rsbW [Chlamydiales bacterium]